MTAILAPRTEERQGRQFNGLFVGRIAAERQAERDGRARRRWPG